jgi:hypothetical protein
MHHANHPGACKVVTQEHQIVGDVFVACLLVLKPVDVFASLPDETREVIYHDGLYVRAPYRGLSLRPPCTVTGKNLFLPANTVRAFGGTKKQSITREKP